MEKVIDIIDTINNYSLDMVNCYDRPLSIVLNRNNKKIGHFYLMFTMLFKSYYHEKINESYEQFYFRILDDILKIKLINKKVVKGINEQVIEILNLDYPVLVPCNLYELYYSEHYKKNNWSHLLLIIGYDDVTKLYTVLDSQQQTYFNDEMRYCKFKMRQKDLVKIAIANNYFIKEQYIYFFETDCKEESYISLLIKFIEIFIKDLQINKCIQNYLIDKINSNNQSEDTMTLFVNANKSKKVAISELIKLLRLYDYKTDYLEKLNEEIFKIWNKHTLIKIKEIYQNKYKIISYLNNREIIDVDKKLIDELLLAKKYLLKKSNNSNHVIYNYRYLNNTDKIIKFNNENIDFYFNKNKTYNTWICDNAPKIVLVDQIKNSIKINCGIKILHHEDVEGFMAGIYIKLLNENIYMFGLDYMGKISLQLVGKKNIISNFCEKSNTCILQVLYLHKNLMFIEVKKNEINTIYTENNILIKQIGLFCKTWNGCINLKVRFNDVKIDNIK